MNMHMHTSVHARTHTHAHTRTHAQMHAHTHTHTGVKLSKSFMLNDFHGQRHASHVSELWNSNSGTTVRKGLFFFIT